MLTYADQERVWEEPRANRFPRSGLVQCATTLRSIEEAPRPRQPRDPDAPSFLEPRFGPGSTCARPCWHQHNAALLV